MARQMTGGTIKAIVMLVCLGWHSHLVAQNPSAIQLAFSSPASKVSSLGTGEKILHTAGALLNLPDLDKNIYLYGYRLPALIEKGISLEEILSQAAIENTHLALVVPFTPENREEIYPENREETYMALGVRVSANDWSIFTDSDRVQVAWDQFSEENPVIVRAEAGEGWFTFSKPLARIFPGAELEAKDFVASRNLWEASQMPYGGLIEY